MSQHINLFRERKIDPVMYPILFCFLCLKYSMFPNVSYPNDLFHLSNNNVMS